MRPTSNEIRTEPGFNSLDLAGLDGSLDLLHLDAAEGQNDPANIVAMKGFNERLGAEMFQVHDLDDVNFETLALGEASKNRLRLVGLAGKNDSLSGLAPFQAHRPLRDVDTLLEDESRRRRHEEDQEERATGDLQAQENNGSDQDDNKPEARADDLPAISARSSPADNCRNPGARAGTGRRE